MENFKKVIYDSYVTKHNKKLYGDNSIEKIESSFPAWKYYFERHLPKNKNVNILDIGCGDGNFIHWLQSLGYKNSVGVDISEEQIKVGHTLGIPNLYCQDLNTFLKERDITYDLIVARDVIEHFTRNEVFEILALINNNLSEKGRFLMQVPCGQGIYYTSIFYGDYTHEMAYTPSSIYQIALNTGFTASNCYPVGPAPTGLFSSMRYCLWQLKVAQIKFWKLIETGNPKGIFTQNLIAVIDK